MHTGLQRDLNTAEGVFGPLRAGILRQNQVSEQAYDLQV